MIFSDLRLSSTPLSACLQARHAFYGALLMGILAHHITASAGAEGIGGGAGGKNALTEFDAFQVGWKADPNPTLTQTQTLT